MTDPLTASTASALSGYSSSCSQQRHYTTQPGRMARWLYLGKSSTLAFSLPAFPILSLIYSLSYSVVELNLTLICSCSPAFRQLLLKMFPSLRAKVPNVMAIAPIPDSDVGMEQVCARRLSSSATMVAWDNNRKVEGNSPWRKLSLPWSARRSSSSATAMSVPWSEKEPACFPDGRCTGCGLKRSTVLLQQQQEALDTSPAVGPQPHPGTQFLV